MLFDAGKTVELDRWDRVGDPEAVRTSLLHFFELPQEIGIMAARALATHPDASGTIDVLLTALPTLPPLGRRLAAKAVLIRDGDSWVKRASDFATAEDPILRRVAAETLSRDPTTSIKLIHKLARDSDAGVQADLAKGLSSVSLDPVVVEVLTSIEEAKPAGWLCIWCDRTNPPSDSCESCRHVGPEPRKHAREALGRSGE
jgi:hypothetical protein